MINPATESSLARRGRRNGGFTIVELLVVIGIMTVLAAILVPVISSVRLAAQRADTGNQIQALSAAITAYHQNFNAYPGPLDDRQMCYPGSVGPFPAGIQGPQVTMAENLFLGLVGGLSSSVDASGRMSIRFDQPKIGVGPYDLSYAAAVAGKPPYEPFIKEWAGQVSGGFYKDFSGRGVADTNVPEFVDRFRDHPTPILYLRARHGAPGIIYQPRQGDTPDKFLQYQYDLRQISAYTSNGPDGKGVNRLPQGLSVVDDSRFLDKPIPDGINYNVLPYLKSTTSPGTSNQSGNPRVKDTFILISAGEDGIFGTRDDITTFGSVIP